MKTSISDKYRDRYKKTEDAHTGKSGRAAQTATIIVGVAALAAACAGIVRARR